MYLCIVCVPVSDLKLTTLSWKKIMSNISAIRESKSDDSLLGCGSNLFFLLYSHSQFNIESNVDSINIKGAIFHVLKSVLFF